MAATKSATGPANIIPSILKNKGRIKINGNRKMIYLVRDKKPPIFAFPIAVKKLELVSCRKLSIVKNR